MGYRYSEARSGVYRGLTPGLRRQGGAAAIEAALLFVIFFSLFYAIASYSVPMLMMQSFHHAASSGARAAVAVDPATPGYQEAVEARVRGVVGQLLNWLPLAARDAVLGDGNQKVQVDYDAGTGILTVTVSFPNYTTAPLIPILSFPGIGDVPKLPQNLTGLAAVQL